MARAYSQDLRDRVIDAALGGMPARRAAAQFEIGIATAIVWVRRARASGERTARRQGQPRRSKLDPQHDFLRGLVEQTPDMTIVEMQQRLATERGIFTGIVELQTAINRYVEDHNAHPKPFVWKADPDKIIAAAARGHQTLDSIH